MATIAVSLRNVPGTEAAMGWAGGHTVVIDRAEGKAGGMGLGFNGGQMLALAIGGCFCNDVRYTAEAMGVKIETLEVDVSVELGGKPSVVTRAEVKAHLTLEGGGDPGELIRRADADSTVGSSVRAGFPVRVVAA